MKLNRSLALLLSTLLMFSCGQNDPEINSVSAKGMNGVIYGKDDRQEVDKSTLRDVGKLSEQVAAIIERKKATVLRDGSYKFKQINLEDKFRLCPEEKFAKQIAVAHCTASLIAKNRVLTAGHCIATKEKCDEALFVFDYKIKSGRNPQIAEKENVYSCKQIVRGSCSKTGQDWVIIELDRDVVNRTPVTLGSSKALRRRDTVMSIGFPNGIPMKVTTGKVRSVGKNSFLAETDTYLGNSGGPIFDKKTGHQIGIMLQGERDFEVDNIRLCLKSAVCASGTCRGEKVQKVDVMSNLIHSKPGKMKIEHPVECGVPFNSPSPSVPEEPETPEKDKAPEKDETPEKDSGPKQEEQPEQLEKT